MSSNTNSSSGGIGFLGALTILFVALKLIPNGKGGTIIDWSWWLVLSPIWIIPALLLVGFIFFVVYKIVKAVTR